MSAKIYQNRISELLKNKFPEQEIIEEWTAFKGLPYQYALRVDIAIGPFSVIPGRNQRSQYNDLFVQERMRAFLEQIYAYHLLNVDQSWLYEIRIPKFETLILKNQNARCFLAFEIENSSSKKHIMGSIVNAASLGRIGIGVAYNESAKRSFLRILNYLAFLKRVEKNTYSTTNFLIITKEQLEEICQ